MFVNRRFFGGTRATLVQAGLTAARFQVLAGFPPDGAL